MCKYYIYSYWYVFNNQICVFLRYSKISIIIETKISLPLQNIIFSCYIQYRKCFYDIMINICIVWTVSLLSLGIYSLTLKTEDVIFEEGDTIILNCTYDKDRQEEISHIGIRWQKQIDDYFQDIALFSPPGGLSPFFAREMWPFYRNRIKLIAPNISLSAVMNIEDPICSDQGIYRCWIEYFSDKSVKEQTSSSVVKFKCNIFFLIIH